MSITFNDDGTGAHSYHVCDGAIELKFNENKDIVLMKESFISYQSYEILRLTNKGFWFQESGVAHLDNEYLNQEI